ncbi:MAG: hypothetical protein KGL39_30975 [Patescibacteria group bacterium]|nr:hypothetical protein [Patescibacteria group bacterium]
MKRRKCKRNALCLKLEKGNGTVGGMKLLYPVNDTALIPVTVRGIDFDSYAYRGVAVRVEPDGGAGSFTVEAPKLVDDTPEARDFYFRKSEAQRLIKDSKPRSSSERDWRSCLTGLRARLTDAQRERFDKECNKITQGKVIARASHYEMEKLLPALASIAYDVDLSGEVVEEDA